MRSRSAGAGDGQLRAQSVCWYVDVGRASTVLAGVLRTAFKEDDSISLYSLFSAPERSLF